MRSFSTLALLALWVTWLDSGCATAEDPRRRMDGGALDGRSTSDAPGPPCDPVCETGYVCEAGGCVPASDVDGDGVPSDLDCDDTSASVGRMAERPCSSPCSAGVERCVAGVWAACTAPTECVCTPGEAPRMVPCSNCGMQRQICDGGTWRDDGTCSGAGDCPMGDVQMGGPCGRCGVQARTCAIDCTWGAWTCTAEGACTEGMVETGTEACGACGTGTRTRSRTCGGTCGWGAWSDWGACMGDTGECAPGDTRGCSNGDACGHEVCGGSCTWGSCEPTSPTGCLRIRPGTSGPAGNNYQCCSRSGADPTGWQFCLPSCSWSTACDATTSC